MKKSFLFLSLCLVKPLWAAPAPKALPASVGSKLKALLRHPKLQNSHIGVAIVALGKAKSPAQFPAAPYDKNEQPLLFSQDAQKRFTPASNFKLFTAAWVLHQLGAKKTFATRVVSTQVLAMRVGSWPTGTPYPSVLTLYGDGDPSLATDDIQALAKGIAAQIPSAIIVRASDTLFPKGHASGEEGGRRYPDGWTLDDALWYYGAPVNSLAINRNQVDVTITGSAKIGEAANVKTQPEAPFSIFAPVITVAPTDPRAGTLRWTRGDANSPLSSTLTVEGFLAPGKSVTEGIAVPDPRGWAQSLFDGALRANGAQVIEPQGFYGQKDARVIAQHTSAPLSQLLQRFLKNSDNLYGEMLLRRAAVSLPSASGKNAPVEVKHPQIASTGTASRAHLAMLQWLQKSGVPTQGLRFSDGSGLSRYNLATPLSLARLLGAIDKMKDGNAIYSALPVAGVDGTLKSRMNGTSAQRNVRAKTGTFSIVNCLSGYVTTRDGQRLAVSIMTNFAEDGELTRNWQGQIFSTLANADFRQK